MQEFASGVYGKVYADNDGYVYKVFYTENKTNESGWIREIVSLKNLNHPNIISPKYIGSNFSADPSVKAEPNLYIKMKKYSQLLKVSGALTDGDILQSILDLFNGLSYLHSRLIMHRDIKEANLLYESFEGSSARKIKRLIICDFSLARYTVNTGDIKHFNYLTPETITLTHRPPEVFQAMVIAKRNELEQGNRFKRGKIEYNELVDIWSVGVVMFFLLTGIQLYYAIFIFGKDDEEFLDFVGKINELSYVKQKIKAGQKINGEDWEKIFTYLMLSDSAIMCIKRWLTKYENKKLVHLQFFKSIMFDCLADVNERPSAVDLVYKVSKYILDKDLTAEITDSGIVGSGQLSIIPTTGPSDEKYIYSIISPALVSINSSEVKSLILKKMSIILGRFCKLINKNISELNQKYVIATAHIVEILFLYANIFTDYFGINYHELYKYMNAIFNETDYLAGLF